MPLDVVIPAAGRTRDGCPGALRNVRGEPLVHRQLRLLRATLPRCRVVVVTGHHAELVERVLPRGVVRVRNRDYATTNVARSVAVGLGRCRGPALVVYGDLVFNAAAVAAFRRQRTPAVLVEPDAARKGEVGVNVVGGRAAYFSYGLPVRWCQMAYLDARCNGLFCEYAWRPQAARWLGHEVLNLLAERAEFAALAAAGAAVRDVDSAGDLRTIALTYDKVFGNLEGA